MNISEEDREHIAKLIAQLEAQQAAIAELLEQKAAAPLSPRPDAHTHERRKSRRLKLTKTPR